MPVKKFNPITPGMRTKVGNAFTEVTTSKPEKSLLAPLKKSGGRNNSGRMTVRQRGGGHKRRYRVIDFRRNKDGMLATVNTIEYDPNRSAFIALVQYEDGEKRYIIAPDKLKVGDQIQSGKGAPIEVGNALPLSDIPLGSTVHAIEMRPGQGGSTGKKRRYVCHTYEPRRQVCHHKAPFWRSTSGTAVCKCTLGTTSNPDHSLAGSR
jgi:large subunit ribosomal protein L2